MAIPIVNKHNKLNLLKKIIQMIEDDKVDLSGYSEDIPQVESQKILSFDLRFKVHGGKINVGDLIFEPNIIN